MSREKAAFEYDVALSFAGENRQYVEEVSRHLKAANVKVFYDEGEQASLWGKDLYIHLDEIYQKKARYCVMFISEQYRNKLWTNHERQSAQARAFKESEEYVLPARFDDTEIPGIRPTIGYVDLRRLTPVGLAELICQKLGKSLHAVGTPSASQEAEPPAIANNINLLLSTAKTYMGRQEYRIQLDELIGHQYRNVHEQLGSEEFKIQGRTWSDEEFRRRVSRYEEICEPLARLFGLLGRWGDGGEVNILGEIFRELNIAREDNGLTALLSLQHYPLVLAAYSYGIGLTKSERFQTLFEVITAPIPTKHRGSTRIAESYILGSWSGGDRELWQRLNGYERRKTPLSDHLLDVFRRWMKDYSFSANNEETFNIFEFLAALAYSTVRYNTDDLAKVEERGQWLFVPVGRLAWQWHDKEKFFENVLSPQMRAKLLLAGFCGRDGKHFDKSVSNIRRLMGRFEFG
jgi:hypothetical protein